MNWALLKRLILKKKTRGQLLLDAHHEDADEGIIGWKYYNKDIGVKSNGFIRRSISRMSRMQKKVSSTGDDANNR